jgi:hypothetical protein
MDIPDLSLYSWGKDTDSTALIGVEYAGQSQKNVYDRRVGNTSINAYLFTARFGDGGPAWTLMVNPGFSQTEAKALAYGVSGRRVYGGRVSGGN